MLYLALDVETTVREFGRLAARQGRIPSDFLPRDLFTYEITLQRVVDLRTDVALRAVGLGAGAIRADDLEPCQRIGQVIHDRGFEALIAPSATGQGDVLVVFVDCVLPSSSVEDVQHARWQALADL